MLHWSRGVERRTEPCGDTSFDEGKEEDETKDNGVSSLDVGFLLVSVCLRGYARRDVG